MKTDIRMLILLAVLVLVSASAIAQECEPLWECTSWSECINNEWTRNCTDTSNCNTTEGRPALSEYCNVQNSSTPYLTYHWECFSRNQIIPPSTPCNADCCHACMTSSGYTTNPSYCAGLEDCECSGNSTLPPIEPTPININSPINGEVYNSGRVWLNVTLSRIVSSISYKLDSGVYTILCTNCDRISSQVPPTTIADGTHTITVKVVEGVNTTTASVVFTIDTAAPVIISTIPADGAMITGKVQTPFKVTYSEVNPELVTLYYKSIAESSYKSVSSTTCAGGTSAQCTLNANLASYPVDTVLNYYFSVYDGALTATSPISLVTLDTVESCTPIWNDCDAWSSCVSGKQTRTCRDSTGCNSSVKTETKTCTTGGGGGGGGGAPTISELQKLTQLKVGVPGTFVFAKSDQLYITEIIVELSETSDDPQITLKKGSKPSGSSNPYGTDGNLIGYILFTPKNIPNASIIDAEIYFKIDKQTIEKKNASIEDIMLVRYLDKTKEWQKLNTSFVKEDTKYAYYVAGTPGFSTFAIITELGASALPEEQPATNTTLEEPVTNQTEGAITNTTQAETNQTGEPPKATGFSIADIPKSPVFMGVLIFLAIVAVIIVVVRITGRSSVRLK